MYKVVVIGGQMCMSLRRSGVLACT